ncbi:MAG: hypothetical protein HC880_15930 [Bacteroidia bacterium]|nr:hypothetical protein [Bacteroidia bacterium]
MQTRTFLSIVFIIVLFCLTNSVFAQMNKAYEMANGLARERLAKEDSSNIEILENLDQSDVVVVSGTYDHIHLVLQSLKIPFVSIQADQLPEVTLKPHQTVFVNCASSFPPEGARILSTFVTGGGQMISTDWALVNVIEVAFPNIHCLQPTPYRRRSCSH